MSMKQREILNFIALDFKRDKETQQEFLERTIENIYKKSREYLEYTHQNGYILGLSGGIDSFVSAALLGNAGVKVHLLLLPNGTQKDISDSIECADALTERFSNITVETVSIENAYAGVVKDIESSVLYDEKNRYALGNTQARLRMVEQYALGTGMLVAGTDHATENITGYFTKHGDGGSDFNPIDGLLKPDIYEIAQMFGAPECVMKKKPAAGLGISENDEAELKMSYNDIASYLRGNILGEPEKSRLEGLYDRAMHKRMPVPSPQKNWWQEKRELVSIIVVDDIYAFIDGGLACKNTKESIKATVDFINMNPDMQVMYVRDFHPEDHCSFEKFGGIWPVHAVAGTRECEFAEEFYSDIKKTIQTPIERFNVFNKGMYKDEEQYSGYEGFNLQHGKLKDNIEKTVIVSGTAAEYCIKNTVLDLLNNGHEVYVLKAGLGYVDKEGAESAIKELIDAGAKII